MRSAPPVRWPCAQQRAWLVMQVTLYALAASAATAWLSAMMGLETAARATAALLSAVLAALAAARGLRDTLAELNWNGQSWSLMPDGGRVADGRVDLMVDLGQWMLLRFRPDRDGATRDAARWIAVSAGTRGAAWSALRAALYSSTPLTPLASASAESQPD